MERHYNKITGRISNIGLLFFTIEVVSHCKVILRLAVNAIVVVDFFLSLPFIVNFVYINGYSLLILFINSTLP